MHRDERVTLLVATQRGRRCRPEPSNRGPKQAADNPQGFQNQLIIAYVGPRRVCITSPRERWLVLLLVRRATR